MCAVDVGCVICPHRSAGRDGRRHHRWSGLRRYTKRLPSKAGKPAKAISTTTAPTSRGTKETEVHHRPDAPPKGCGEMGIPTLAPALANAIF